MSLSSPTEETEFEAAQLQDCPNNSFNNDSLQDPPLELPVSANMRSPAQSKSSVPITPKVTMTIQEEAKRIMEENEKLTE